MYLSSNLFMLLTVPTRKINREYSFIEKSLTVDAAFSHIVNRYLVLVANKPKKLRKGKML